MTLPMATTTIDVLRLASADMYADPYANPKAVDNRRTVVASGVRAVMSTPSGGEQQAGGEQSTIIRKFDCDVCDITYLDLIKDNTTGIVYEVQWVAEHNGFGLDHMSGKATKVSGLV